MTGDNADGPDDADWVPAEPEVLATAGISPGRSRRMLPLVGGLAFLLVALVVGAVVLWPQNDDSAKSSDATRSTEVPRSTDPAQPSDRASQSQRPKPPLAGVDGLPGPIAGNNFAPAENPYTIADFGGVPFAFGIPEDWDCLAGSSVFRTTGVATCTTEGSYGAATGGSIGYSACRAACTPHDIDNLIAQLYIDRDKWRKLDDTTGFADIQGMARGGLKSRVGLYHVFTPEGSAVPSGIAYAQLTGPIEQRDTMLKVLNSIRANLP